MGNFGAKGTLSGYDVETARDYLQSFNSSWPLLKVQQTGQYGGTVSHGLSYPPMFFVLTANGAINQYADYAVDSSVMVRNSGSGTPRYYIFNLNLLENFEAPTVAGETAQAPVNKNFGFKVAKAGKSVYSQDMRDFSLHSGVKSPMLHKVDYGPLPVGGVLGYEKTISHNLGYTPTVFVYMKPGSNTFGLDPNRWIIVPTVSGTGNFALYEVTNSTVTVYGDNFALTGSPEISVVILKDPFNKQTITKTYPS